MSAPTQYIFQRYEKKYLLTPGEADAVVRALGPRMTPDEFGRHTIANAYYDTPNFDLIRTSLEKPVFKEKFRLRTYDTGSFSPTLYAEIKRKFRGIVYKRRIDGSANEIHALLEQSVFPAKNPQIEREIAWFFARYPLSPKVYLAYERTAYIGRENPYLRVTFDENIRFRRDAPTDFSRDDGIAVVNPPIVVMEVKTPDAMPLWLTNALTELRIFPHSFSKYGTCFRHHLAKDQHNGIQLTFNHFYK